MRSHAGAWLLALFGAAGAAGQVADGRPLSERYDFATPSARFDLPGRLEEISGLAVTADGRVFGHDDERATVHEIDLGSGRVGKRFSLGEPPLRGDFEALAIVGERFFLVTSAGLLYEFREVGDREEAPHRVTDTGLGGRCEVEGLDYDPAADALLFACKVVTPDPGVLVIERLPLDPAADPLPPIRVDRAAIAARGVRGSFEPSSVAVSPAGGILLVSAVAEALVEIDWDGTVRSGVSLRRRAHRQPEGAAFTRDGSLVLADERNGEEAHITIYSPIPVGGGR